MSIVDFIASYITLSSEFFLIQCLFVSYILTFDYYCLYLLCMFLLKILLNKFMKKVSLLLLPLYISARPSDCEAHNLLDDNLSYSLELKGGFPSGHSMAMSSFTSLSLLNSYKCNKVFHVLNYYNVMLLMLTCWSRYHKKAHTILQIIVGVLLGLPYGYMIYYFQSYFDFSPFWSLVLSSNISAK